MNSPPPSTSGLSDISDFEPHINSTPIQHGATEANDSGTISAQGENYSSPLSPVDGAAGSSDSGAISGEGDNYLRNDDLSEYCILDVYTPNFRGESKTENSESEEEGKDADDGFHAVEMIY